MSKEKKHIKWFRLDNAGKLYPSIMSTRVSTVFRLSFTLTQLVDVIILQKALDNIMVRFPYFQVNLKKGLFWYYFEHTNNTPLVEEETYYPCMFLHYKKRRTFPFRILHYNNKISIEITHSITDGTGAIIFFKSLIIEYFKLKGYKTKDYTNAFMINSKIEDCEYEDAFHKYYKKNIPTPPKLKTAFHFPFSLNTKGEYHILTGILNTNDLLQISRDHKSTITQFLLAIYFLSTIDYINTLPEPQKSKMLKPIVLNVPVNLRKLFPSNTLNNFFISLTPTIDPRLGDYTLDEIIKYIKNYMDMNINKKYISRYISRNVKNEKHFLLRSIPLPIKNLIMPYIYSTFGERNYTSSISNLGKLTLPDEFKHLVERFEMYPAPSTGNIIKVGITSYNNKTCICFGRLTSSKEIEQIFFRKLIKMKLNVKIETNY